VAKIGLTTLQQNLFLIIAVLARIKACLTVGGNPLKMNWYSEKGFCRDQFLVYLKLTDLSPSNQLSSLNCYFP